MDPRLVGAWHVEGITTLHGNPDPDNGGAAWSVNPAEPEERAGMRGSGFVFRADGTGQNESRHVPPTGPPSPFTWRVETEDGKLYTVINVPGGSPLRQRIWINPDGRRLLWFINVHSAALLLRDDAPRGSQEERTHEP